MCVEKDGVCVEKERAAERVDGLRVDGAELFEREVVRGVACVGGLCAWGDGRGCGGASNSSSARHKCY